MYNLIGEAGSQGNTIYQGLDKALAIEGVFVHQYGKSTTKPGRKMGHVTIVDNDKESLLRKLFSVKSQIHVVGDKTVAS
jgi:5-(carboxyamino)imidazole ribonucleotide synthase